MFKSSSKSSRAKDTQAATESKMKAGAIHTRQNKFLRVHRHIHSGKTNKNERRSRDTITQVPWSLGGALLVAITGLIVGEAIGVAIAGTWLWVQQGYATGVGGIIAAAGDSLPLLFVMYMSSQLYMGAAVYSYVSRRGGGWRNLGFRNWNARKVFKALIFGSVGFLVAAMAVSLLIEQYLPHIDVTAEQQIPFMFASNYLEITLSFLALVIVAPVVEEMVFRGLILPAAAKVFGIPVAVVVISILFGLLHPPAITMVTIGIFGLILSWVYIRGLSLWPAIILHSAKNLIAFIAIIGPNL